MPEAVGIAILTEIGAVALAANTVAATAVGYVAVSGAHQSSQFLIA